VEYFNRLRQRFPSPAHESWARGPVKPPILVGNELDLWKNKGLIRLPERKRARAAKGMEGILGAGWA